MGKSDFSQMKAFQKRLEEVANGQQKQQFYEACAREIAARFLAKVIKRTPVGQYESGTGKSGGSLRRGWTSNTEEDAQSSNATPLQHVQSLEVKKVGYSYQITIINPMTYASYVEYGHRTRGGKGWVPGQFMMTISEKELQIEAPGVLEKKLESFLKEVLDGK